MLRHHIESDAKHGTLVLIDDVALDMAAFGWLLETFAGFGSKRAN